MKNVFLIVFIFSVQFSVAQDYINAAVVECCTCFKSSESSNQDSALVVCSINAIRNNLVGLTSDLELYDYKNEDALSVLRDRMIKYFKKCPEIKKYFKARQKNYQKSKG